MGANKEYLRKLLVDKSSRPVIRLISPYEWEKAACVILRFEDASLPPEGHRSFSMQFTPNDIKIEVDSYGHILASYKEDITLEKFMILKCRLSTQNIGMTEDVHSGKAGGCGGSITLKNEYNGKMFYAYTYGNCWETEGNLTFDGFLFEAAYTTFPWLEDKIEELVNGSKWRPWGL